MIHGVDVSSYQATANFKKVRAAGADFVIVKVTEGNGYINQHAERQVLESFDAGLYVMLYHFARPNGPDWEADARDEADRLDERADAFERRIGKKIFCWYDCERNTELDVLERQHWRDHANEFKSECRRRDRGIGWYSYSPFTASLALPQVWEQTLLWLARYPVPFRADCSYPSGWPDAPLPWARPDLWQHGGDANGATWDGIEGKADVDSFAGTLDELAELIANAERIA